MVSIPLWFDWHLPASPTAGTTGAGFNPTVVRLAPGYQLVATEHDAMFQSHCGSIGTGHACDAASCTDVFQSHCGSIGTSRGGCEARPCRVFQSHCGSIGTTPPPSTATTRSCFNPTVVRLAPWRTSYAGKGGIVSIPLWFDWHEAGSAGEHNMVYLFQSHCGSIGTRR